MAKYKIGTLILILTALFACSTGQNQGFKNTAAMTTPEYSGTNTSVPTKMTQIPTSTSPPLPTQYQTILPSETAIITTITPTNSNSTINYTCLDIQPNLPSEAVINGVIITHGYALAGKSNTYLLNFASNTNKVLPVIEGNVIVNSAVSPNRQWMAYLSYNDLPGKSRLIIANSDGRVFQDMEWQNDWYRIPGWLDNEHLLITKRRTETEFGSLVIVDRINKEQRELTSSFPDMMYPGVYYLNWGFFSESGTIYNPPLTRVLYPRIDKDMIEIALWDITNDRILAAIPTVIALSPEPRWAPDGKTIAIAQYDISRREKSALLLVDESGKINQLTKFDNSSVVEIGSFDWSPNGRYIAFWLYTEPNQYQGDRLSVIDMTTGNITNYCIPGSINGDSQPPIWSPDSSQLIVENYLGDNDRRVILLDIVHNFAAQIAEDVSPVGWMVAP